MRKIADPDEQTNADGALVLCRRCEKISTFQKHGLCTSCRMTCCPKKEQRAPTPDPVTR